MAFPVPAILPSIEDLLFEVQWLEGLILVTDSQHPTFVSKSQIQRLYRRLLKYPKGDIVSGYLRDSLQNQQKNKGSYKPVLLLHSDGRYWLGIMGISNRPCSLMKEVIHLNRCYKLN